MVRGVAVIGAGVMGHGIAQLFAQAGHPVRLQDSDEGRLLSGLSAMEESLALLAEEEVISPQEAAAARARVRPVRELESALGAAELVVECIPEVLEAKLDLYDRVERLCGAGTLLASNTSTIPVSQLAQRVRHPERMIITHFFNPAQLVPLVEVLPHPAMGEESVERVMKVLRDIGKHPVRLRKEVRGFIANRLQAAMVREAFHLVEEGVAEAADIDAVITEGPGMRWPFIGPIETADLGGLDTWQRVLDNLAPELSRAERAPAAVRQAVARGDLGAKTGRGIYDHAGTELAERLRQRDRALIRLARLKKG